VQDFRGSYFTSNKRLFRVESLSSGPINKLPPELLGDIFVSCLEGWNCVSVESLMAVCGAWMGICLETPALWSKVVLNMTHWASPNLYKMRSNYVHHHLSRSGVIPMRVTVDIAPSIQHVTVVKEHVRLAQAVLHLLSTGGATGKGADCWSALEVSFNAATPRRLLDFLGISMPSLRELTVKGGGDASLPIMQTPGLLHLQIVDGHAITGYSPDKLRSFSLSVATLSTRDMDQLASLTSLESLSLIVEKNDRRLPKVTLPNLRSLEIMIKPSSSQPSSPSDNSFQLRAAEPVSLKSLILPRLETLVVMGDNPSLISVATLRNLNQVRHLELKEHEFLVTKSRRTEWGFLAYSVVQTPAMIWNPSSTVVEYTLSQCVRLEEIQAPPSAVKLLNCIFHRRPDLRPCLRLLQSKYRGTLNSVTIKGSEIC
jgi:hypothetical protein